MNWSIFFWTICLPSLLWQCQSISSDADSETISDAAIAVLPFNNNTGDPTLDVVGEMAADWITNGLHETGEGKILSLSASKDPIPANASEIDNNSRSFLIDGSYYESKDSLYISCHIKDLKKEEIVYSSPILCGDINDPMPTVEEIKQHILGFWVTKDRTGYERRPPLYEAYKNYIEASKLWYEDPYRATLLMQQAATLDSNFHFAIFGHAHRLISESKYELADSIIAAYQVKKPQLTKIERAFLDGLQARITKNHSQMWSYWNLPYIEAYWGPTFIIKQKSDLLLGYFNQPQMALDLLEKVDFSTIDFNEEATAVPTYFRKIEALCRLGRNEEAKSLLVNLPFTSRSSHIIYLKYFGLGQLMALPEIEQALVQDSRNANQLPYPAFYNKAYAVLGMITPENYEIGQKAAQEFLDLLEHLPDDQSKGPSGLTIQQLKMSFYLALEDLTNAEKLIADFESNTAPDEKELVLQGIYYAQANNEKAARNVIAKLEKLKIEKYDFGKTEMWTAIIEAWLGNHQKAIDLLVAARNKGRVLWFFFYDGDWRLRPISNLPEFKTKVLAPLPVPSLNHEKNTEKVAANTWWIWIFAVISLLAINFYFLKKRRREGSTINTDIQPNPTTNSEGQVDDFLINLHKVIERNMNDPDFNLPKLCKSLGLSRAQVYRKIKEHTDQSPAVYVRSIRLQKAKELLQNSNLNISEVAYEVGFKDLSYFSRSFSEEFGLSPSETRK